MALCRGFPTMPGQPKLALIRQLMPGLRNPERSDAEPGRA